jgi:hypothetical protein
VEMGVTPCWRVMGMRGGLFRRISGNEDRFSRASRLSFACARAALENRNGEAPCRMRRRRDLLEREEKRVEDGAGTEENKASLRRKNSLTAPFHRFLCYVDLAAQASNPASASAPPLASTVSLDARPPAK